MSYTKNLISNAGYIGFIVLLSTDNTKRFDKINAIKLLNNKYFIDSAKHNDKKNCVYLYLKAVLKEPEVIDEKIIVSILNTLVEELEYKSAYGKLYFTPIFKGQNQISINCGYTENNTGFMFK